jgi:hypothetical protein
MPPVGVRDGAFVKFEGWDIPGHDVGQFFKNLSGDAKINALKKATLQYGSTFFAFNTNGWSKAWLDLTPSSWVPAPGSTLWIRVEYPGWVFFPGKDMTYSATNVRSANGMCHI